MITFDPETAIANPEVLRKVARGHQGTAGIYGAVLAEGMIRKDDPVTLLD
jgi:MOSC domain-containing protein YiiM